MGKPSAGRVNQGVGTCQSTTPLEIEGKDAPTMQRALSCMKELSIWIFEEKWLNQKHIIGNTGPDIIGNQLSKNAQMLIATDQWEKQHVNPGAC